NPAADAVVTLTGADNWPGDAAGTILPGGFAETGNKMYILGGFNINVASTNEIWQFDPNGAVGAKWLQRVNTPEGIMYAPTCAIGGIIYVGCASDFSGGLVIDTTSSFSFNPTTNTTGAIAAIPRATGETRGLTFNGNMYVMGGGRVAPNPSNQVNIYNPGTNTWSIGLPFTNARRNFPTDTNGTDHIWLAGGYEPSTPAADMEIFAGACPSATPTPTAGTPSPTPTCQPGGTPGPWQNVANMPTDLYGAAGASNGTFFYAAGGYSFSSGMTLAVVNRYNPGTNTWTPMMSMPQAAIEATAVYYPTTNKIYVFGGEDAASGTNYNITRIYDIATNTWTTGANMPDVHSFAAGTYIPATGKIYIISGYNTGQVTSAQPNTWSYDPVANTWTDLTGTLPFPHPAGGTAFGVINNKLYIAGGRDAANTIINLTWAFDPVAGTYTAETDEPGTFQNNVPGSAAASGLLFVYGGGNPFSGAEPTKAGLTAAHGASKLAFPLSLPKGPQLPATSNAGRYYNPANNTWT